MNRITLEIDMEKLKQELERTAIETTVRNYFDANDIDDWEQRKKIKSTRLKDIVGQVDWNKLPEEMQRGVLRKFVEEFILRR